MYVTNMVLDKREPLTSFLDVLQHKQLHALHMIWSYDSMDTDKPQGYSNFYFLPHTDMFKKCIWKTFSTLFLWLRHLKYDIIFLIPAANGRSDIVRLACLLTEHQYYSLNWRSHLLLSLRSSCTLSHLGMSQLFCCIFLWCVFWLWSHVQLRFHPDPSAITVIRTK